MKATIYKISVEINEEKIIGITEMAFEFRLPSASEKNRDAASFATYDSVAPGEKISISVTEGEKKISVFEGVIVSVNISGPRKSDGLMKYIGQAVAELPIIKD